MCITFFIQSNEEFPFVIVFNRDELTTRLAEPLRFQGARGMPNIVCGIDVATQSTWFALNKKTGDFACLTNYRTSRNRLLLRKYDSRGFLVLEYVKINDPDIKDKMTMLEYDSVLRTGTYRGFNLVFGNIFKNLWIF